MALACLALPGCCATARVRVLDLDSGQPVSGAVVRPEYRHPIGHPVNEPGRPKRTDSTGRATLRQCNAIEILGFKVEADGYQQHLPPESSSDTGATLGDWSAAGKEHMLYVVPSPGAPQ